MIAQRSNSLLEDIFIILVGVIILLAGMAFVNCFVTTELASFIDIIPMMLAIWFIVHFLKLNEVVNKTTINVFYIIIFILTLVILIFSINVVFSKNGYFYTFESQGFGKNEHAWAFNNIRNLSQYSLYELLVKGKLDYYNLDKYGVAFSYCSLMFRYGGVVLTHICIWRAFHLAIVSILIMLSATKLGIEDERRLSMIMTTCLLLPMFDTIFAYNHDAVGYAFIALGVYIYLSSYKIPFISFLTFPIYVLLFYWFRRPYALIAIALFFWSSFKNNRIIALFSIFISTFALFFLASNMNLYDFFYDDLGVSDRNLASENDGRSFINILLITIIGNFPWTILLKNIQWPYILFACFQGAMNITIIYYLLITFRTQRKEKRFALLSNPMTLGGFLFFLASLSIPGHMSYTSVAMPFFLITIENVDQRKLTRTYLFVIVIIFSAGLIYDIL